MDISVIQMEIEDGAKPKNVENALSLIDTCADADIVVLPELWSTGLALENAAELAEPIPGETISLLKECAAAYTQYILGTILENDNNTFYNTLHVVGPHGIVGIYRKIHLFSLMEEDHFLKAGTVYQPFQTELCTLAGVICYDIRFPELSRVLAVKGAEVLIVPAEFPCPRKNHWDTLLKARAIENQFFVIGCNRVGTNKYYQFFGGSTIIDPWGDVVVKAKDAEGVFSCSIDLKRISECRKNLPAFSDIRLRTVDLTC